MMYYRRKEVRNEQTILKEIQIDNKKKYEMS